MNNDKLTRLFGAVRREKPPAPPADFADDVLRALRQEPPPVFKPVSIFDQLNLLFPKIALVAVVVICACVAGEIWSSANSPGLGDGIAEISDQWSFTAKGF